MQTETNHEKESVFQRLHYAAKTAIGMSALAATLSMVDPVAAETAAPSEVPELSRIDRYRAGGFTDEEVALAKAAGLGVRIEYVAGSDRNGTKCSAVRIGTNSLLTAGHCPYTDGENPVYDVPADAMLTGLLEGGTVELWADSDLTPPSNGGNPELWRGNAASLTLNSTKHDLALIEVASADYLKDVPILQVSFKPPRVGQDYLITGHAHIYDQQEISLGVTYLGRVTNVWGSRHQDMDAFAILRRQTKEKIPEIVWEDADHIEGASGGGIMGHDGRVVGVISYGAHPGQPAWDSILKRFDLTASMLEVPNIYLSTPVSYLPELRQARGVVPDEAHLVSFP